MFAVFCDCSPKTCVVKIVVPSLRPIYSIVLSSKYITKIHMIWKPVTITSRNIYYEEATSAVVNPTRYMRKHILTSCFNYTFACISRYECVSLCVDGILFFIWHNSLDRARTHIFNLHVAIIILHLFLCAAIIVQYYIYWTRTFHDISFELMLNFIFFSYKRFRDIISLDAKIFERFSNLNILYTRNVVRKIFFICLKSHCLHLCIVYDVFCVNCIFFFFF